ncbi:oxidoreductase [Plantactinospora soyae]|uniref:Aryl-alcohol dehydrogenase-like predicted oxidoreductase n=1 Tax=Plantactinospora soyae TaxID=1544732 RepID=A0A927M3I6_9ACTN|nr:oxidoreductase [Plantactinospora soyae]MBE1484853.1 aryl-alcohol dehydrogenase-like predicted oxidoreductase [Plantactinospora soyae]
MTTNTPTPAASFLLGGDLRINRLGFGAMRLAANSLHGPTRDPRTGIAVLRRAVELGVDHIDTAGFYGRGDVHAHELIRQALYPYPEDLVIATKVGPLRDATGMPSGEADAGQLRGLVEEDLRRLGLERLDLVYLRVGGLGPVGGESIAQRYGVLAALREEGLIRHLGISNVDAAQYAEAEAIAPVTAVQNHFHLQHRDDAELLARCTALGSAYVPFFPLGGGNRPLDPSRYRRIAERHGATAAQVALAWLLARSPVMLAIPGTGSPDHLEENMAAATLRLSEADLAELSMEESDVRG